MNCFKFICNFKKQQNVDQYIQQNIQQNIMWEDTVPFKVPITEGYVIKVYDGDTITIASKLPFDKSPLYRFSVRLNGINSPEIKGKSEEECKMAKKAQLTLSELILYTKVTLKNVDTEKYGRILADVYLEDIHVNNWMIENRLAVKYDGGTKKVPVSWLKYYITGSCD